MSALEPAVANEQFTLQIQGKGVRIKVRIPGWAIAYIVWYAQSARRAGA